MALIVQKYGGSSVKDIDRIKNVANRVAEYRRQGDQVVVVVSAMGGVTDNLIRLSRELNQLPSERELDMLLATGEQTTIALLAMALVGDLFLLPAMLLGPFGKWLRPTDNEVVEDSPLWSVTHAPQPGLEPIKSL